jgi:peptide deformylase
MALRQIRMFDDEILRKKSKAVEVVDDKIRKILNDMADTMYNTENGGG